MVLDFDNDGVETQNFCDKIENINRKKFVQYFVSCQKNVLFEVDVFIFLWKFEMLLELWIGREVTASFDTTFAKGGTVRMMIDEMRYGPVH